MFRRTLALLVAVASAALVAGCASGSPQARARGEATTTAPAMVAQPNGRGSTSTSSPLTHAVEVRSEDQLYAAPDPVPDVPHGTLLRYQRVEPGIGGGGPTYRILYASRSVADAPIVVSGWVHLPAEGSAGSRDGLPMLGWAHGTTGMADRCAPSRTLEYVGPADPLVEDGFAVVATDYEGLGTPGLHPYLVGESEGRSVLDALLAARQLPGVSLSARTVLWGHSQGGHAVAFAHQLAPSWAPDLDLLGTVAIAPPAHISRALPAAAKLGAPRFAIMTFAGTHAAHPDAALEQILTPEAIGQLPVLDEACDLGLVRELDGAADPLVADPSTVEPWATYLAESDPGGAVAPDPVLIVQGAKDTTVPQRMTRILAERWCGGGQALERWVDPEAGHSTVLQLFPQMRQWTLDRVSGRPAADGCADLEAAPPPAPTAGS